MLSHTAQTECGSDFSRQPRFSLLVPSVGVGALP